MTEPFTKYYINDEGRRVVQSYKCNDICENKEDWISKQTDPEILDPKNCQSSCLNKTYDCDACTDPEYDFICEIARERHCLNPVLICDGHPACDDGSDEDLNIPGCFQKLVELKRGR